MTKGVDPGWLKKGASHYKETYGDLTPFSPPPPPPSQQRKEGRKETVIYSEISNNKLRIIQAYLWRENKIQMKYNFCVCRKCFLIFKIRWMLGSSRVSLSWWNRAGKFWYLQECVSLYGHTLRGHFSIGTIGPRESVLCSQLSSDVVRVQSL